MPIEGPVDGWSGYGKHFSQIADGIVAYPVHPTELLLLFVGEFWLLAAQLPFGAGDLHAFAGTHTDQVGFKFSEGGQDVEEHLSHGVCRVVDRRAERQLYTLGFKLISNGARIRYGSRQSVKLWDNECVPFPDSGQ